MKGRRSQSVARNENALNCRETVRASTCRAFRGCRPSFTAHILATLKLSCKFPVLARRFDTPGASVVTLQRALGGDTQRAPWLRSPRAGIGVCSTLRVWGIPSCAVTRAGGHQPRKNRGMCFAGGAATALPSRSASRRIWDVREAENAREHKPKPSI